MIFEFLTKRNVRNYSVKVAKIFGVYSAVFISMLLDTKEDCEIFGKMVNENYFIMSRQDVYNLSGLEDTRQKEVEQALIDCGIIDVKPVRNSSEKYYYMVNSELLLKILMADNIEEAEKLLSHVEGKKSLLRKERVAPPSKRSQYILNLKKGLSEPDPVVRELLNIWIDTIYEDPRGFLAPTTIAACIKSLNEYSGGKQKIKKEVIEIAIKSQHKNLDWSIEQHTKSVKKTGGRFTTDTSVKDIDKNIEGILQGNITGF